MNQTVARYVMNPAEDEIRFGDELTDGMWVLREDWTMRSPFADGEDAKIRQQRFRRVTRLRHKAANAYANLPAQVVFVGEWVDGYQEVHTSATANAWLVKKPAPADEPGQPS